MMYYFIILLLMIHIQKIRKLIYNLLEYYSNKESKSITKSYYYLLNTNNFLTEFECLSSEKKIGILSKLPKTDVLICIKLLEMLYERDYNFITNTYKFIFENDIIDKYIEFDKSLDNLKFWIKLFKKFYSINKTKPEKFIELPKSLKNYKTKKTQKFYQVNEIITEYYFIQVK